MYIVLGATGHVGSAVARALLDARHEVTVLTRDRDKGAAWAERGARVASCDIHDTAALRTVFRAGRRAFLLNPPADVATDTDMVERKSIASLLAALDDSGLEAVVAQSTYGAQPGERCGDLSTLYELERGLAAQPIPALVIRAAYYMSNWQMALSSAREKGTLPTMYPADLKMPMVSPDDVGGFAANGLTNSRFMPELQYVEGPERYSATDAAACLSHALHRQVEAAVTPPDRWEIAFQERGFSVSAADSYARMTRISAAGRFPPPSQVWRGPITLKDFIARLNP